MKSSPSYIVAASQLFAIAFGAPLLKSSPQSARSLVERTAYRVFGGDGTVANGWPQQSDWQSFETMWAANSQTMTSSCGQFSMANDSQDEINDIKTAILKVAGDSQLPSQFILAILMQESQGCVRAPTTNYGVNNPGLMQSYDGTFSCNPSGSGTVPCPAATIEGMISEGAGIGRAFGLTQAISQSKATDVSKYYKGARIYNSGSIAASGNLGAGIATHCYASDIANRLIGWADGQHGCDEATIGNMQGSAASSSSGNGNGNGNDNTQETQTPTSTTPTSTTQTPAPAQTSSSSSGSGSGSGSSQPTGPKAEGASASCSKWYTVKAGDTCMTTGLSVAQLKQLNTSLKDDCSNLWLGSSYCVAA